MALDFFAGCVGGCAGLLVGHPFDTIKVRLQTDCVKKPRYRSATHCFVTTIKTESFSGLYKGITSPIVGIAFINAIMFGSYGTIQRQFQDQDSLTTFFLAGGLAGCVQAFVASPMELVKTRIQIQGQGNSSYSTLIGKQNPTLYKGPIDCVQKIYASEGLKGVFRGQCVTLLREFSGIGLYFASYEYLTQRILTDPNEKNSILSTGELLLAGGLAGVISWTPTYPIDMIKSRLQVDGFDGPRMYKGAIDCAIKSYQSEGLKAFTRGMAPTLLRAFPTNAATFTVVAWIMRLYGVEIPTEMDDKQEALVLETPSTPVELKPAKESSFLVNLKGIGALTLNKEISKLAMCSLPKEDTFLQDMKVVSRVSFLHEELSKTYDDRMVSISLPNKAVDATIQEENHLNQEMEIPLNEATDTLSEPLSSKNKPHTRKLSMSEVFHLDLSLQDCELSGSSSLTPEQTELLTSKSAMRRFSVSDLFCIDLSLQDCELSASPTLATEKSDVFKPQRHAVSVEESGKFNLAQMSGASGALYPAASDELHFLTDATTSVASASKDIKQLSPEEINHGKVNLEGGPVNKVPVLQPIYSDQRYDTYQQKAEYQTRSQECNEDSRAAILINEGIYIRNCHHSEGNNTGETSVHNLKGATQENNSYNLEDSEVAPCSPTCTNNTRCCTYSMDFIEQETQKASDFSRRLFKGMVRHLKVGLFDLPTNYDI